MNEMAIRRECVPRADQNTFWELNGANLCVAESFCTNPCQFAIHLKCHGRELLAEPKGQCPNHFNIPRNNNCFQGASKECPCANSLHLAVGFERSRGQQFAERETVFAKQLDIPGNNN
jgi:hypothetical protein